MCCRAPSCRRRSSSPRGAAIRIQVVEGYVSKVEWPREKLARYRDFFSDYTGKVVADRPANIRTLERYLLLANDLPGLKFTTTLQGVENRAGRVDADRRGHREAARRQCALRQPRHQGARPATSSWSRRRSTTCSGSTRRSRCAYAGHDANRGIAVRRAQLSPCAQQRRPRPPSSTASYSWGRPGTPQLRELDYKTRSTIVEAGVYYPVIRSRENNLTVTGLAFMSENYSFTNLTSTDPFRRRPAARHSRRGSTPTSPTSSTALTSSASP